MLNPEHPLCVLAERIDWQQFDVQADGGYASNLGRPGHIVPRVVKRRLAWDNDIDPAIGLLGNLDGQRRLGASMLVRSHALRFFNQGSFARG